jgi:hypothetical protein
MALTRREFLVRAGAAALVSGGPYALIDRIVRPVGVRPQRVGLVFPADRVPTLPAEQHLFLALPNVTNDGTLVTVPPLHHLVVTADLNIPATVSAWQNAQNTLESTIAGLEDSGLLDFTAPGLGLAVSWGLPYFNRLPPALTSALLPIDIAASRANQQTTFAILNAIPFASDPPGTILERNDVAFVLASDIFDHIEEAFDAIFKGPPSELMSITSIRRGFVDAHHLGSNGQSLTKRMAMKAGIPGAASIPDEAELFLGFTSTQRAALGQSVIANFESLPAVTNQWPNGYFANGTTMHLSHIFEDLESWYSSTYRQRAGFAFSPRIYASVQQDRLTLPAGPARVESLAQVEADFDSFGFIGHSTSMQPVSRLLEPVTDNYGNDYPTGTAIPERADFNTLDNPFLFSSDPEVDGMSPGPAAGVHFVVFLPTSTMFDLMRQAMDGQYSPSVSLGTGAVHSPFNNVLQTTHRQNFLVPPRAHRSFPLVELMT